MRPAPGRVAGLLAVALAAAGCGSGHPVRTSVAPVVTNPSSSAKSALAPFLLAAGEEVGYPPDADATNYTSARNWAAFSQAPGGAQRLTQEGFVDAVIESIGGSSNSGSSDVTEFSRASGARADRAAELQAFVGAQPAGSTRDFRVARVPGARGIIVSSGGTVDTNVFWTEGRCAMILGNSAGAPLEAAVTAAVRAIDVRTHGSCP